MILVQDVTAVAEESPPLPFPDVFLCPMCGSVGHLDPAGFSSTERPAWFRCLSCEYVFAFERPRPLIAAERHHES